MERLLAGDSEAWQTFIASSGRLIRSRVADVASSFGFSQDGASIDDATADVFGSLLANDSAALRAFAGRSSLTTYLAVIATRCATRIFARKRHGLRKLQTTEVDELQDEQTELDPSAGLLKSESRDAIRRHLEDLPWKQREVVRLFHLEGKSYAAISDELSIPIGSIGVTLRRAEAKLRERLEPTD